MTYLEKINYVKAEMRMMFDSKKQDSKINNSVYRFGADQNLHSLTYRDIKESLDKILNYDQDAKLPPMPPINSQLGSLTMPAGFGLIQPTGPGFAPFMPGAMPFAYAQP